MARNKFDIDETLETPFDIKHLKRSFIYIKKHTKKMVAALLLSALGVVISLFGPILVQRGVDVAVPNKDIAQVVLLSAIFLGTIVINVIFITIRSKLMVEVGQDIVYDIRKDLFNHLQELPFKYYDDRPHGKIMVRIVNYVNNVSDLLSNGIINFVLELFNIIFILIFMFSVSVKLSLVVLAGLPVFMVVIFLIKNFQRKAWQQVSNKSSNMNAYLHESINGIRVTQIFTREEQNAGIFARLSGNYRKAWLKATFISQCVWYSVDNIATIISALIYIVGMMYMAPEVSFGVILAMSGYASRFWQPIMNLSNLYNNFINTIAYLERIFEAMDEPVTITDAADAYELPKIEGQITFDHVTFAYEPGKNILEDVSFTAQPGESIALVGPTGAGKTTIVNLISRFYDVDGGAVLIDGNDVSRVTLHSLRSQMGIMLQDSFIFSGTLLENIKYGKLDATDEEVRIACQTVCADEFIEEMEKGYDTEVNERGSRLSQGQKQLIAFARTLLCDPKVLILDEATSSIDAKTERLLQKGLQELLKGRTSFIIAHRLSTIMHCDKIMYISNKGITECGTHEELMAKRGDYYHLYTSQLQEA